MADWWQQGQAITGLAAGRGNALFLDTPFGPAVLRRYLRGGWPAWLSRDRYLYLGRERSRPFREFHLLRRMHDVGLPVPAPLAALCERGGLRYRGALLMERIMGANPMESLALDGQDRLRTWTRIGACIRKFHHAGVHHADLNARNILVDPSAGAVYLVDFDRCRYRPGTVVQGDTNLARLKRSLYKLWPVDRRPALQEGWQALMSGYDANG
jgi:3-deoxy-D-manno-octulosonic acid kinase